MEILNPLRLKLTLKKIILNLLFTKKNLKSKKPVIINVSKKSTKFNKDSLEEAKWLYENFQKSYPNNLKIFKKRISTSRFMLWNIPRMQKNKKNFVEWYISRYDTLITKSFLLEKKLKNKIRKKFILKSRYFLKKFRKLQVHNLWSNKLLQKNFFITLHKKKKYWTKILPYKFYYSIKNYFYFNKKHNFHKKSKYKSVTKSTRIYVKLLKISKKIFDFNTKSRSLKLRTLARKLFKINTYSYFKNEMRKFITDRIKKILFFQRRKAKIMKSKKVFFVQVVISNRNNTLSFFDSDHKLILKRTTKSLGLKTRKLRRDIVKTKFLFQQVFYFFKNFLRINYRIKRLDKYFFIFCLVGDANKTAKVLKYIVAKSKVKLFSIMDVSSLPHNGCRAPKKRRKKNRGRNRYIKKIKNC